MLGAIVDHAATSACKGEEWQLAWGVLWAQVEVNTTKNAARDASEKGQAWQPTLSLLTTIVDHAAISAYKVEEWQLAGGLPSSDASAHVEANTTNSAAINACEKGPAWQPVSGLLSNEAMAHVDLATIDGAALEDEKCQTVEEVMECKRLIDDRVMMIRQLLATHQGDKGPWLQELADANREVEQLAAEMREIKARAATAVAQKSTRRSKKKGKG